MTITQSTSWRISIGYLCVAELTTRLPSSIVKPSNCNNFRILLVYSRHRDSRVSQSSSTNIAARRFSCCASTVWNSLPSFVRTADSKVLSLSSRLTYSRDICSRSTVRASDTLTGSFARYTFVTSLLSLNCRSHALVQQEMVLGRWDHRSHVPSLKDSGRRRGCRRR